MWPGSGGGYTPANIPFPSTYYYYEAFYTGQHKVSEVTHPTDKAIQVCMSSGTTVFFNADDAVGHPQMDSAHGKGMNMLFVDGHSQFALFLKLNKFTNSVGPGYNFDTAPLNLSNLN
jgi:prepilin-type processing-associated H-X9-DG protein